MVASHIHHALEQVHELRHKILERQRFRGYSGYSGYVRMLSGTWALLAAAVMSSSFVPQTSEAHLVGWGIVCGLALVANYGAVGYRFLVEQDSRWDIQRLRPILDGIPALVVGGLLTVAMLRNGHLQYLFGIWMSLFGLTNIASRHALPPKVALVGCFYVICGAVCLFLPGDAGSFLNPWPMGIVFFVGEWAGGMLLYLDEQAGPVLSHVPATRPNGNILEKNYADKT